MSTYTHSLLFSKAFHLLDHQFMLSGAPVSVIITAVILFIHTLHYYINIYKTVLLQTKSVSNSARIRARKSLFKGLTWQFQCTHWLWKKSKRKLNTFKNHCPRLGIHFMITICLLRSKFGNQFWKLRGKLSTIQA